MRDIVRSYLNQGHGIFAKMLGITEVNDIDQLRISISRALRSDKKIKIPDETDSITKLMLYASYDIHDERLTQLLKTKSDDFISREIGIPQYNDLKISALGCAAATGSANILRKLLAIKKFSPAAIDSAVLYGVLFNHPNVLKIFFDMGYDIFPWISYCDKNPLHFACLYDYKEVVRMYLSLSDDDDKLGEFSPLFETYTPYQIALAEGHHECAASLENLPSSIYVRLAEIIKKGHLGRAKEILSDKSNCLGILGNCYTKNSPLLVHATFNNPSEFFNLFLEASHHLSADDKLLVASNTLRWVRTAIFMDDNRKDSLEPYILQIEKLIIIKKQKSCLANPRKIYFEGIQTSREDLELLGSLLVSTDGPATIVMQSATGSMYDLVTGDACSVNIGPYALSRFFNTLLQYPNVIKLELLVTTLGLPFLELNKLMLERNRKIQENNSKMIKDKIFNQYVKPINEILNSINSSALTDGTSELLVTLKKILHTQPYSLKEYVGFFIQNSNEMHEKPKRTDMDRDLFSFLTSMRLVPDKISKITIGTQADGDIHSRQLCSSSQQG